jgi:hypothetical protein
MTYEKLWYYVINTYGDMLQASKNLGMKAYRESGGSAPGIRLYSGGKAVGTPWIQRWVDPKSDLVGGIQHWSFS